MDCSRLSPPAQAVRDRWVRISQVTVDRLLARQRRVVVEKLSGTKTRKGTRHFIPAGGGAPKVVKVLAVDDVWDEARWHDEFATEMAEVARGVLAEVAPEVAEEAGGELGLEAKALMESSADAIAHASAAALTAAVKADVASALERSEERVLSFEAVVAEVGEAFEARQVAEQLVDAALGEALALGAKHGDPSRPGYRLLHPDNPREALGEAVPYATHRSRWARWDARIARDLAKAPRFIDPNTHRFDSLAAYDWRNDLAESYDRHLAERFRQIRAAFSAFQEGKPSSYRAAMEHILLGGEVDDQNEDHMYAETLLQMVHHAPPMAPELYRGTGRMESRQDALARYPVGRIFQMSPASFSADKDIAENFALGMSPRGDKQTGVIFRLLAGAQAFPAQALTDESSFYDEAEWITGGQFRVVRTREALDRKGRTIVVIDIAQEGTFGLDEEQKALRGSVRYDPDLMEWPEFPSFAAMRHAIAESSPGEKHGDPSRPNYHLLHPRSVTPEGLRRRTLRRGRGGGGFTFSLTSKVSPKRGYAVSIYPQFERGFSVREFEADGDALIAQYQKDHAELLAKDGHHLGGWHDIDGEKVYLDVSVVMADQGQAEEAARQAGQDGIMNLATPGPEGYIEVGARESRKDAHARSQSQGHHRFRQEAHAPGDPSSHAGSLWAQQGGEEAEEVAKAAGFVEEWEAKHGDKGEPGYELLHPGKTPLWRTKEPEWEATPEELSDEEHTAHWKAQRDKREQWKAAVRLALARGDLTAEEALDLGYHATGHDNRESVYVNGRPAGGWQPLPPVLYHLTTAASAVRKHGLKTRDELRQLNGVGLGGGESDTISFTVDEELAHAIKRGVLEFRRVARGEVSVRDLMQRAREGIGASRPFEEGVVHYWKPNWKTGDPYPMGLVTVLDSMEHRHLGLHKSEAEFRAREGDDNWRGYGEPIVGTDGVSYYIDFVRPLSKEKQIEQAVDFYKWFAAMRQHVGGPTDPLFFSSDWESLAKTDPDEIQILRFRPKPKAQGYPLSGMAEWRTTTGEVVELDGTVKSVAGRSASDYTEDVEVKHGDKGEPGYELLHPKKPWRVVSVTDTRQFEEGPDEKWRAVPGSGDPRPCDRCGKEHEIHVEVEKDDGERCTVGLGCARIGHSELDGPLKAGSSAATTIARLRAEADRLREKVAAWELARAEVEALPIPPHVVTTEGSHDVWTTEDDKAHVWVHPGSDTAERLEALHSAWRAEAMRERGFRWSNSDAAKLEDVEKRLARAEKKLRSITEAPADTKAMLRILRNNRDDRDAQAQAIVAFAAKHGDPSRPGYRSLHPGTSHDAQRFKLDQIVAYRGERHVVAQLHPNPTWVTLRNERTWSRFLAPSIEVEPVSEAVLAAQRADPHVKATERLKTLTNADIDIWRLDRSFLDELVATLEDEYERHPVLASTIKRIEVWELERPTRMAEWHLLDHILSLNSLWWGKGKAQTTLDALSIQAAQGLHPKSMTGLRGIVTHEIGHALHGRVKSVDTKLTDALRERHGINTDWMGQLPDSTEKVKQGISAYAATGWAEMIAEAYADFRSGKPQSELSEMVGAMLDEAARQRAAEAKHGDPSRPNYHLLHPGGQVAQAAARIRAAAPGVAVDIDALDPELADELADTIEDEFKRHPVLGEIVRRIEVAEGWGMGNAVAGWHRGDHRLVLNARWFSEGRTDEMFEILRLDVAQGGHPPTIQGVRGIVTHELAHALHQALRGGGLEEFSNFDYEVIQFLNASQVLVANSPEGAYIYDPFGVVSKQLGKYAATTPPELVAEAYADWRSGSPTSEFSATIGSMLDRHARELGGSLL